MLYEGKIWLGTDEHPVCLLPQIDRKSTRLNSSHSH